MPWKDKNIIKEVLNTREQFDISTFVETGTFEGIGARFWSKHFDFVHTCEIDEKRYNLSIANCRKYKNIFIYHKNSPEFLAEFKKKHGDISVIYLLDAHWDDYWPILDELKTLENTLNCSILIHDFHSPGQGLGHDKYNKIRLNMAYVKDYLFKVNPNFSCYYNLKKYSELWSVDDIMESDVLFDSDSVTSQKYNWSNKEGCKRGILLCTPAELKNTTLSNVLTHIG